MFASQGVRQETNEISLSGDQLGVRKVYVLGAPAECRVGWRVKAGDCGATAHLADYL